MSTTSHVGPSRAVTLEQLQAVLELSPVPTAVLQWGRLLFLNRAATALLDADDAGKAFCRLILGLAGEEEREDNLKIQIAALKERKEQIRIARKRWVRRNGQWIRRAGSPLVVEVEAWSIPLEGGDATQLTFRDITEHHGAEQNGWLAETDLQLAMESSQVGIWEFNPAAGRIHWSECCCDLFEVPQGSEIDYPSFLQHIHPEDRSRLDRAVQKSLNPQGRGGLAADFRILRADGQTCWIAAKGHTFFSKAPEGRKAVRLIGTMLGVTGLRQADSSFLQQEKLVATERLAASLAHEINNPLEAMTNLLYLLEGSALSTEQRKHLAMARQELTRVIDIASHSLHFYRDPGSPTQCQVPEIIDSVLALFGTRIEASHIRVERRDGQQSSAFGSRGELRQVLINMVHNAVDAMPHGGRLLLRTGAATEWSSGRTGVRISIADNGQGMDPATLKRLFEPFFTTRTATGMGLGLWLGARIVRQHGGSIRVKSCQNTDCPSRSSGTVISIFLPSDRRR